MANEQCITPSNHVKDLTGIVVGRWTVIGYTGVDHLHRSLWLCECECGTRRVLLGQHLRKKQSTQCGCVRPRHGGTYLPEYRVWANMLSRCRNPKASYPHLYSGRGISVCKRWESFAAFLEDMGPRPSPKHSIDRIDNNQGYHKNNCRWATRIEQARNVRKNRMVAFNGKTQCLAAWAEELDIPYARLFYRLKRGWSVEKTFMAPLGG